MRVADEVKSSWADEVEEVSGALPAPSERFDNGIKTVTEYIVNSDGKKMKIVRTYKVEKRVVSKNIALRKTWSKYGDSKDDKPGPNPHTTFVAEEVFMQFISNKEEQEKQEDNLQKLLASGEKGGLVKCRTCNGDHFTTRCPYKDTGLILSKTDDKKAAPIPEEKSKGAVNKYVPPSLREGATGKRSDTGNNPRGRDDSLAIRISNLSESTQEADLEDLVRPFGPISKIFLAKDKPTGLCKGFAYIHFKVRADAAKAIAKLDGYGYDHLILSVDWSKPNNPS